MMDEWGRLMWMFGRTLCIWESEERVIFSSHYIGMALSISGSTIARRSWQKLSLYIAGLWGDRTIGTTPNPHWAVPPKSVPLSFHT